MISLAALVAALGPALGKALYEVGKKIVIEPLLEPATEQLKARMLSGYKQRVDAAKVRGAVETAMEAAGVRPGIGEDYPLRRALHRLAEPGEDRDALREAAVAAALAMTDDAPEAVPDALLEVLAVDAPQRPALAHFLWALRQALADADEDYAALVTRAHEDAVRARLREIVAGVNRLAETVAETDWGPAVRVVPVGPKAREIEAPYLRSLVERECRFLPLGGRDPRASTPTGLPIHLEKVYIALDTTERPPEAQRELLLEPGAKVRGDPSQQTLSALRVVLDYSRLVLLGDPGSGKSTFADHLALCLAGERREPGAGWIEHLKSHDAAWEGPALLPIRIRLRDFAADKECLPTDGDVGGRAEHLLAYVEKALRAGRYGDALPAHALACLLDRGDALLILDGLDEVGDPARREQVAQAIRDLAQHRCAQRAHLLVTCRVRQYPLDSSGCPLVAWALPGFHAAALADFDGERIRGFVDAWFAELYALGRFPAKVRDKKVASLKEAIALRVDLQEIAPRPILLTQMVLVHDIEGELPGSRVKLYAACAELLLWKWEQLRAERAGRRRTAEDFIRQEMKVPGLQKEDLQRALDHAVYDAHAAQGADDEGPTDIPEETLRQQLCACLERTGVARPEALGKAQQFIDQYLRRRNGLIVPAGEHTFQTPHRTFQEFLAARWLQSQRGFDRTAPELVDTNYALWREVFLLAVGQARLGDAVDAVAVLCPDVFPEEPEGWQHVILAGQGLEEIGWNKVRSDPMGPETERRVIALLQRTMQDTGADAEPNEPPRVPVATRYAAGEVLDRLGWPPDAELDAFIWIEGPGGGFYIGKYPVTNGQYARFVEAGGYEDPAYWGGEDGEDGKESAAWRWRVDEHNVGWRGEGPVTQPEYWDHPRFGRSRRSYPVVGVSWYEANAYCRWLQAHLPDLEFTFYALCEGELELHEPDLEALSVRLPTDEEWVVAAGGEKEEGEDRYPWGTAWHESCANTGESSLGGITPVAMYPAGRSDPWKVWDMGGNVWEWLGSEAGSGFALRGGSWRFDQRHARVGSRYWDDPDDSSNPDGFRVVASPAGSDC